MLRSLRPAVLCLATLIMAGCSATPVGTLFTGSLETRPGVVNGHEAAAIISSYRASRGLGPVKVDQTLTRIAETHAQKMASMNRMEHVLPGQGSFSKRIKAGGYKAIIAAENIGAGYNSLDSAIQRWQASPGHNKNLLNPQITEIGIAVAYAPESRYQTYWALVMAAPLGVQLSSAGPSDQPWVQVPR